MALSNHSANIYDVGLTLLDQPLLVTPVSELCLPTLKSQTSPISPIMNYSPDTPANNFLTSLGPNEPGLNTSSQPTIPMFSPALHSLVLDTSNPTTSFKSSNVTVTLDTDRNKFVAGQDISGRLTLVCTSATKVKLGEMTVGLIGFEETQGGKKMFRRGFLSAGLILQSGELTSEACVGAAKDADGYRLAKKGRTVFGFRITVPSTCNTLGDSHSSVPCPSSFWADGYGGVRYILAATCFVKDGKSQSTKPTTLHTIHELEMLSPAFSPTYHTFPSVLPEASALVRSAKREFGGWMGKKSGWVGLRAMVHVPGGVEGTWTAGGRGYVQVSVANLSERKMNTMRFTLLRQLRTKSLFDGKTADLKSSTTPHSDRIYSASSRLSKPTKSLSLPRVPWVDSTQEEKERWWAGVEPGSESRGVFEVGVPMYARTVEMRGGLVGVQWVLQVAVGTSRDDELCVEVPVCVLDPLSLLPSQPPSDVRPVGWEEYERAVLFLGGDAARGRRPVPIVEETITEPAETTQTTVPQLVLPAAAASINLSAPTPAPITLDLPPLPAPASEIQIPQLIVPARGASIVAKNLVSDLEIAETVNSADTLGSAVSEGTGSSVSNVATVGESSSSTLPVRGALKPQPKWEEGEVVLKLPKQRGNWMKSSPTVETPPSASASSSDAAVGQVETQDRVLVSQDELTARIDLLMREM